MLQECGHGRIADCSVIEVLADHGACQLMRRLLECGSRRQVRACAHAGTLVARNMTGVRQAKGRASKRFLPQRGEGEENR